MQGNRIKIGENIYESKQWLDTVIHKDYRGQGVYSKMRKYDDDKLKLLPPEQFFDYSVSTNPIIITKEKRMGNGELPYPLMRLIRIGDIEVHLRNHKLPRRILLRSELTAAKGLSAVTNLTRKGPGKPDLNIVEVEKFDERINPFWAELKKGYSLILERSPAYLNWRYRDHRGGIYTVKQAEENGEVVGYIVTRINRYDKTYPTGYIVDLCALPNRIDCAAALVSDAMRRFEESRVNMVSYLIFKGHPYQRLLSRFGFLDSRNNVYFGYGIYNIKEENELPSIPAGRVLFQFGDFDWI